MAVSPPSLMLKIIWLVHFVLTSWALLSGYLSVHTYWFTHAGVLAFGMWAMVQPESVDAVIMFIVTMLIAVLNDIILLALYEPRGHDTFEGEHTQYFHSSAVNEYRFALGMTITNLLVTPVSLFLLYRIYQSRSDGTAFNTGFPAFGGGSSTTGGAYDNIESHPGKSPEAPGYYQEPPPPMGNPGSR